MSSLSFRALVVDDDVIARKTVAFALSQENFVCELAVDGDDALAKLSGQEFDLLVTDLQMPNKHGYALANEILDHPTAPVIIVHSSIDHPKLIKDLMARGVDDVICKPANYRWLAAKAKGLVVRRRTQRTPRADETADFLRVSHEAIDVLMMIQLEQSSKQAVLETVQRDPALAAELLRMANSAALNPAQRPIESLSEAVHRIGSNRICEIITDQLSAISGSPSRHPST